MPEIIEKLESREGTSGENPTRILRYKIDGTADDMLAEAWAILNSPYTYAGLVRKSSHVAPAETPTMWDVEIRYGERTRPETGESEYSFDTTGGSRHLTQSLSTTASYAPAGETAPDFRGAIGVHGDTIDGVDIPAPTYKWTETHYVADNKVTDAYKKTIHALTGTVNSDTFRGFEAGEVRFMGAAGSRRSGEDWQIAYSFEAEPNKTDLMIDNIGPIAKKGWEYLWVLYEDAEDAAASQLVQRPVAVYVEKVHDLANFADLGLG